MKYFWLVALVACGDGDNGVSTAFEVHDTIHWSANMTPDVVELLVDGESLASDQWMYIDETYPSYEDARRDFVPRTLELTTISGTRMRVLDLGNCDVEGLRRTDDVLVEEAARYSAWRGFAETTGLGAPRGTCVWASGVSGAWIED